jgi:predicted RNA methylase
MSEYDAKRDAALSYDVAIAEMRRRKEWSDKLTAAKRVEFIGNCMMIQGDCLEVMPQIGKVDAILMDPPYGLSGSNTDKNNYLTFSDEPDVVKFLVNSVIKTADYDRLVMTPGQKMMFSYPEPNAVGVFYYPAGTGSCSWGFVGWQPIFYYGKDPFLQDLKGRASNSFYSTETAEKNGHPCPKPIGQWTKLLKRISRENETILDPFMGSGTTGVACVKTGRHFIGIELDPDYFEIACRRVREAYAQPDLLIDAPKEAPQVQEAFEL